ncbi:hypothetical protein LGT39_10750 [Demequina sp. TTPB684]|uniref:hypothetical protein n=1 Tax=unclassified Demequina TaxID=2620311 RepID=UPI001CF282EE|nr:MULTISPECIES: hypothetical protein [unclassified Demequina]MCB2413322.1 hypothetical protein [Demequina sp. TTPB684]UPU87463.1 hypothetical protein LGT36_009320 [Demequina sp. TMPB413]
MHSRAKVAAVALGAALVLSSCSLTSSVTTSLEYDPSDGTSVAVGDVRALNITLITTAEGEPGAVIGALYNAHLTEEATVTLEIGGTEETYDIPPMVGIQLGVGEGTEEFVTTAPTNPGLFGTYTVTVEGEGAATGALPVMDGTLPQYADVLEELEASAS